jgi:hypothetical protein
MDLGFHIADFTWNGGSPELAPTLGRLAGEAEALRAGHDLAFTTTYVFARNPEPLAAIELLAGAAGEVGSW